MLKQRLYLKLEESDGFFLSYFVVIDVTWKKEYEVHSLIPKFALTVRNDLHRFGMAEILRYFRRKLIHIAFIEGDDSCTELILDLLERIVVLWSAVLYLRRLCDKSIHAFRPNGDPVDLILPMSTRKAAPKPLSASLSKTLVSLAKTSSSPPRFTVA